MKVVTRNILTGMITVVPMVLTLYLIYWLVVSTEGLLGPVLARLLPDATYWPGLGVLMGLAIFFVVGMMMNNYIVRRVFQRAERLFYRLPLIKAIYPALRDFMDYFSPIKKKEYQQVVAVTLGNTGMQAIGLITRNDVAQFPEGFNDSDSVLVYLPMSYMIGGYALLVPRSAIRPLDMSMDDAMRFILTAGVTGASQTVAAQQPQPDDSQPQPPAAQ